MSDDLRLHSRARDLAGLAFLAVVLVAWVSISSAPHLAEYFRKTARHLYASGVTGRELIAEFPEAEGWVPESAEDALFFYQTDEDETSIDASYSLDQTTFDGAKRGQVVRQPTRFDVFDTTVDRGWVERTDGFRGFSITVYDADRLLVWKHFGGTDRQALIERAFSEAPPRN